MTRGRILGQASSGLAPTKAPVFWANKNAGIRYVRCELPARALGGHVEHLDRAVVEGRFDSFRGPHVFQLPATRYQLDWMSMARDRGSWVAAEFDDDYTRWDERIAGRAVGHTAIGESIVWTKLEREGRNPGSPSVELVRAAIRLADVTIVSTPRLAKAYEDAGARSVVVCRNSVDPADWPQPQRNEDAPFRVLYAGAPNQRDYALIRKAMIWTAAQEDAEAILVGGQPGWPGVVEVPWVKDDLEALRAFLTALAPDVGLRPLENTRFARGKSDLKILEYAMCGAMSVVAPYEPYKGWEGRVAYARSGDEFLSQMQWAYGLREEVGRRAASTLSLVLAERTIESEAQAWASALRLSSAAYSTRQ